MQLDYTQICSATCGAAYIEKKEGILFHRFTKEEGRALLRSPESCIQCILLHDECRNLR